MQCDLYSAGRNERFSTAAVRRHVPRALPLVLALLGSVPAVCAAGPAGDEPAGVPAAPAARAAQAGRDFFLGRPRASIGIRGNWTFPRAGSDWFDFVTDQLTLDRQDFRGAGIAGEVTVSLAPRVDAVMTADFVQAEKRSEFRDFVDEDRLPIEQTTRLRNAAFTGGVRFAVTGRGREISSLAWIPNRVAPYVGAGGGILWYEVQQGGDFVDFRDLSIFSDLLVSSGWTPAAYANAGADVHIYKVLYVTIDGRYLWAAPDLTEPWRSFEALDLAGLRVSTGVSFVF